MFRRLVRRLLGRRPSETKLQKLLRIGLTVGRDFSMQSEVTIDPTLAWLGRIGDEVTLAPRVVILAHDASMTRQLHCTKIGKVDIGNKVFVGAGTVILPGVTVGDNAIIGAGSVVTKDIPEDVVAAGNPARVICSLEAFLSRHRACVQDSPRFIAGQYLNGDVSDQKKQDMADRMTNRIGYLGQFEDAGS